MSILFQIRVLITLSALALAFPAKAQESVAADPLTYADLADLSADAPIVARVLVKKQISVDPERAVGAPAGTKRYYIVAATQNLIRGKNGLSESIRYIIDLPVDARGRAPKLRREEFLIFARPLGSGDVQLVAPDAHIRWTESRDARIRAIITEAVAPVAPPPVQAISAAFHVPGTIIGEGETQIFMETGNGNPVSITILSRENRPKLWAVSLSEIVDEAAKAPRRGSLLWYRLACFLPNRLPDNVLGGAEIANIERARVDYQLVKRDLGDCPRSRPQDGVPIRLY